ncbi:MAG TPA: tetratricopeptide repeat protein, partial [Candidatus Limnocylindrales bacterium]|nr:tetratricopeptide repeat protein [Candidatus Limnocylindrales bacterium]
MIRTALTAIAVAGATFGATFGAIELAGRDSATTTVTPHRRTTDELIRDYMAAIKQRPDDARGYTALGQAFVQKVRETGNTDLYHRADSLFRQALRRDPANAGAIIGRGGVANSRHDFAGGLRFAGKARRVAPESIGPLPVLVDSQIELGRYDDAARTLQQLVDLKPNVAAYTRVSYWRELHGDLDGAIEAVQRAVS